MNAHALNTTDPFAVAHAAQAANPFSAFNLLNTASVLEAHGDSILGAEMRTFAARVQFGDTLLPTEKSIVLAAEAKAAAIPQPAPPQAFPPPVMAPPLGPNTPLPGTQGPGFLTMVPTPAGTTVRTTATAPTPVTPAPAVPSSTFKGLLELAAVTAPAWGALLYTRFRR